jgi:hypothetical protein
MCRKNKRALLDDLKGLDGIEEQRPLSSEEILMNNNKFRERKRQSPRTRKACKRPNTLEATTI